MKYFLVLTSLMVHTFTYGQFFNCKTTIEYGSNADNGHYAEINGIRMYYETYGDPDKQALLIIHGNGGSVKAGSCQIEYFKNDYFVVVVDSRYQGKSENGDQELTYRLMANDYYNLLNHLGLDSVHIIGQSDGGIIGLLLAMEYPTKVKKLIAAAPNLRPDATAMLQSNIDRMRSDYQDLKVKIEKGDTSNQVIRKKVLTELMLKYPNIEVEELQKINAPVLLIFGDSDYMPFEHVVEIYQNIPKANLFIVPGAGHRTYRLEPEIFNLFSKRFLENDFKSLQAIEGY